MPMRILLAALLLLSSTPVFGQAAADPPAPNLPWSLHSAREVLHPDQGWVWIDPGESSHESGRGSWTVFNPQIGTINWIFLCDADANLLNVSVLVVGKVGTKPELWFDHCQLALALFSGYSGIPHERLNAWVDGVFVDELLAIENGKFSGLSAYEQYGWRVTAQSMSAASKNPTLLFTLSPKEDKSN